MPDRKRAPRFDDPVKANKPFRRKGWRNITVDGERYLWRFHNPTVEDVHPFVVIESESRVSTKHVIYPANDAWDDYEMTPVCTPSMISDFIMTR